MEKIIKIVWFLMIFHNNTLAQDSTKVFFKSTLAELLNQDSIESLYQLKNEPATEEGKISRKGFWKIERYSTVDLSYFKYNLELKEGVGINYIRMTSGRGDTITTNQHSFWVPNENYWVKICFKDKAQLGFRVDAKKCTRKFNPILIPPTEKYEDNGAILFQTDDHHSKSDYHYFYWEDKIITHHRYNLPAGIYKIHALNDTSYKARCTADFEIKLLWEGGTDEEFETNFDPSKIKFSKG